MQFYNSGYTQDFAGGGGGANPPQPNGYQPTPQGSAYLRRPSGGSPAARSLSAAFGAAGLEDEPPLLEGIVPFSKSDSFSSFFVLLRPPSFSILLSPTCIVFLIITRTRHQL